MSQQKQCLKCGELLDFEVRFCTRCGADQYAAAAGAPGTGAGPRGPYETPGPTPGCSPGRVAAPKNYFIESILSTICCCPPLGLVAIIFAAKVDGQANRGDYQGAVDSANKAKLFTILAVVVGILWSIVWTIFFMPEFMKGFEEGMEKARQEQLQREGQVPPPEITLPPE